MKNIYKNDALLSVLIPAYNEERTISELLAKVIRVQLPFSMKMEIIIVNDCSSDNTLNLIQDFKTKHSEIEITIFSQSHNQGKGAAIRKAIAEANGDIMIVQDADLEYDPEDYNLMLPFILSGEYKVVYGSRFLNRQNRHSYQSFYWGGRLVTLFTNLLYWQQHLTDEPTCYKMFDATLLKSINLCCTGFEFCPEVTAKVAKRKCVILEVPIHYYPRSLDEGKKIKWYDGLEAIWTLFKYKFVS